MMLFEKSKSIIGFTTGCIVHHITYVGSGLHQLKINSIVCIVWPGSENDPIQ